MIVPVRDVLNEQIPWYQQLDILSHQRLPPINIRVYESIAGIFSTDIIHLGRVQVVLPDYQYETLYFLRPLVLKSEI